MSEKMTVNMNGLEIKIDGNQILIDDIVKLIICTESIDYILKNYTDLDVVWKETESYDRMDYLVWSLLYDNDIDELADEEYSRIKDMVGGDRCDRVREITPSIVEFIRRVKQRIIERDK